VAGGLAYEDVAVLRTASASYSSHSETNVQVAGVDEGDIVEFDSDYVYMLTGGDLVIVSASDELAIASRTAIEGRPIAEYLHGDRLTIISTLGSGFDRWSSQYGGSPSTIV